MPGRRTHRGAAARRDDRSGHVTATALAALADLVDEALLALGAKPAFALAAGGAAQPARWDRVRAVESPARRAPSPRPLEVVDVPPEAPQDDPDGDQSAEMDADHVETWQLVQRAQSGDGEAFGVLYDRYVDLVFRFIYYRVNDRALAEDFTSETFLRALRRIGSITYQGRDIGAWFVTIARNIVLDHVKSARNRLETTTADTIETREYERSTETAVLETLQSERLMQAVNQLGDEQRECIMLRFIQGLSVSETAAVMGKNDGAIKALQHRAVRKLADIVGGELR